MSRERAPRPSTSRPSTSLGNPTRPLGYHATVCIRVGNPETGHDFA
jgi:hypothetical protein